MENNNFYINKDYGSDREPFFRTKNKAYKIGNFAEEFSDVIPNMAEKEKKSEANWEIEEKNDDLDQ